MTAHPPQEPARPEPTSGEPSTGQPVHRSPAGGLSASVRQSPAVLTIGALNVAAFLWVEAKGGPTRTNMVDAGALIVPMLPGEPWRLLTSTFLHFGAFHLLSNMLGLALFGPAFESLVGRTRFVALWIAAGLAGSAATVLTAGGITIAAGASGSVFGLLGAFAMVSWRLRKTPAGAIQLRQAMVLLGINLAFGLLSPEIGLEAHIGGVLAGILVLAGYVGRRARPGESARTPNPRRGLGLAVAVAVGSVVVALTA